jgi:hypothetical protein
MQGLYPIVRRKRVPLVATDAPPVMVGNVEPVPVVNDEARMTNAGGSPKPESPRATGVVRAPTADGKERRAQRQT